MAMRSSNSWMWAEACEMLERAQRLQRQFSGLGRAVAAQPCWEPPVDIVSCGQELRITAALPGVRPERIGVQMEGSRLLVSATRSAPLDSGTTAVHRLEIPYGSFQRTILLPAGRWELLEQSFTVGCLQLRLVRSHATVDWSEG
jgi:HSP20 family molecular chaperone IbpA